MKKRYKIKQDFKKNMELCENFNFTYEEKPYQSFSKIIITPLHRIILKTDEKMRLFILDESTQGKNYEIKNYIVEDLLNADLIEEYCVSMEDFALEKCPTCSNYINCVYEITKRIDGNANCVYFKENNNE